MQLQDLKNKITIRAEVYCVLFALYNLLAFNRVFFIKLYAINPSVCFACGTFAAVFALFCLCCLILFRRYTLKPLSYLFLLINSNLSYFVKTYNISFDEDMLMNILQTDWNESMDLIGIPLFVHIFVFAVIPICLITRLDIRYPSFKRLTIWIFAGIFLLFGVISLNHRLAFSFIRNNKSLRYVLIPSNYISAVISAVKHYYRENHEFIVIGEDASFTAPTANGKKILLVLIVGETARAANFSLDGYARDTNAPLQKHSANIINFIDASACGTSTAVSVPCMFSKDARNNFVKGSAAYSENLLDIFHKVGYRVFWIENNSDCKDVCNRIEKSRPCPYKLGTCNDDIMLPEIDKILAGEPENTMIVLHQQGSHGPKYYLRYPQETAPFTPDCRKDSFDECTPQELINAYDNTIYYTSQMISDTIDKLQKFDSQYNIVALYASDHGESLGEHGLYLHSAPYRFAPQEQTWIPFFFWIDREALSAFGIDKQCLLDKSDSAVSHDNIFHSFLGLGGISAKEYQSELDLFSDCKK